MAESIFSAEKIIRYFKGEHSEKERAYVEEIFCDEFSEEELRHHLLRQFYDLLDEGRDAKKNLDHILNKIHFNINTEQAERKERKTTRIINWSRRIAGIIILPLALIWGVKGYLDSNTGNVTWVEIKAPAWTRAQFTLPDGTTGWLNSNSSVKYKGNFIKDRRITLKGEAFFDVVEDKRRPFVVSTDEVNVEVLGTRFNIASYDNEKDVEVVLEEGKLIFSDKLMNRSYTMSPNDLILYDKTINDYSIDKVQIQKYVSWKEGKLVFRNDPLDVIARRLERWYNVDVEVNGCLSEDLRWRATFIDDDLEEVLNLLKRSLPVKYSIIDGGLSPDDTFAKKKVIITLRTR